YTLGQKLDNLTLEILGFLLSVPITEDKVSTLGKISVKLDLLKILVRLAKDSQAINNKNYLELQMRLYEIGKMLGGWIRASKKY
ncbi:four helix bundle protein, partial [Candidatus Woesebacteria bacterium]|nr:four helix bundle protein [Candidatus Woesebacteria bacterium]